jgi:hypothetical protein
MITPQQALDFASRDINRLVGNITLLLMRRAPYNDLLEGGTFENGISDQQRNVVIERPVLGQSLVMPEFDADLNVCGALGEVAEVGSTEYVTQLGTLRGRGPKVCVKTMRSAFQNSYAAVQDGLQKQLLYLANVDVRSTLFMRSGVKAKLQTGLTFEQMINGDVQQIDVSFNNSNLPNATLTMEFLQYLIAWAHEELLAEPYESDRGAVAKVIASQATLNYMRNEAGIHQDFIGLTTGRYDIGEETITGYTWEGPYLGAAFGIDQQPLRFNNFTTINGQTVPNLIEPEIAVPVTNGYASRANPAYRLAQYEIALVVFANSFRRLVPEQYLGVGEWRFPAQYSQGELEFVVLRDNDCNQFGDFGYHLYQMIRGYRPERPHAVIPVAFQRPFPSFNFTAQTSYPGTSTLFSL